MRIRFFPSQRTFFIAAPKRFFPLFETLLGAVKWLALLPTVFFALRLAKLIPGSLLVYRLERTLIHVSAATVALFLIRSHHFFIQGMSGWTIGIYEGSSPLQLTAAVGVKNPVLTARHVTDVPAAFVADPFLFQKDGLWHMFFEVYSIAARRGEIGHATSEDGLSWQYDRLVLREPFHLSYPYVFAWRDRVFMVPESCEDYSIRLYEATQFPIRWAYVSTLLRGRFADSTIFEHESRWWMYTVAPMYNDYLRLYWADTPLGPWVEHLKSPVVYKNNAIARPGGRVVKAGSLLIRYCQDNSVRYGNAVRAYAVTTLTTSDYVEQELPESPVLKGSGRGWNKQGMHTVDAHEIEPNRWLAAVDGFKDDFLMVRY